MLRRDRQIRMQIHQLMDACLFALAFWVAYQLRADPELIDWLRMDPVETSFRDFAWLLVVLIPAAPLVLEAQGFYDRPLVGSRAATVWRLSRGCFVLCMILVVALF